MKFYKMWKSKGKDETMRNKKLRQLGKICAVSLALVMPLTDALPYVTVATYAVEDENQSGNTGGNTEQGGDDVKVEIPKIEGKDNFDYGTSITVTPKIYGYQMDAADADWSADGDITIEENSDGTATVKATRAGSGTITLTYKNYTSCTATKTITVNKATPAISFIYEGEERTDITTVGLVAMLQDGATGKIQFYVNGSESGDPVVVKNGAASYQYTPGGYLKGSYTFYAEYLGDENYCDVESEHYSNTYNQSTEMELSIVDKEGSDKESVEIIASGLPEDASGRVVFKVNGKAIGIEEVENGQAACTYEDKNILKGNYSFEAIYSGNYEYKECTAKKMTGPYTQSQKVVFAEKSSDTLPLIGTLDEKGSYSKKIDYDKSSVIQGKKTYTIEKQSAKDTSKWEDVDEKTASISEGSFTTNKSGFYRVKVEVDATGDYLATSDYFYIYVQNQIDLSKLTNVEGAALELDNKVYDGTYNVTGTYKVPLSDVKDEFNVWTGTTTDGDVVFTVKGTADVKDVNVSEDGNVSSYSNQKIKITKVTETEIPGATNIPVVKVDEVTPTATDSLMISKRPVTLGTQTGEEGNKLKITNNSSETTKELVEKKKGLVVDVSTGDNTGFLDKDKNTLLSKIKITVDQDYYYESNNKDKVKVTPVLNELGDDFKNYKLSQAADDKLANLEVTNMTVDAAYIYENVAFNTNTNQYYSFTENDKITGFVVGGGDLTATKKGTVSCFDGVKLAGEEDENKGTNPYTQVDYNSSGERTIYVYLTNNEKICSKPVKLTYYTDVDEPVVSFESDANEGSTSRKGHSKNNKLEDNDKGENVIDNFLSAITFGIYGNKEEKNKINLKSSVEDIPDKNASGIKSVSYAVISTTDTEKITGSEIKKIYENGKEEFTSVEVEEGKSFNIPVENEGTYVALVYAEDQVGNATIYASNGIMVEVEKPTIKITLDDEKGTAINSETPYSKDVDYRVTVNDYSDKVTEASEKEIEKTVISGIKEYTVRVTYIDDEGKEQSLHVYTKKVSSDESYYSLDDLKDLKDTYEGKISEESNNITITVDAVDQAGNERTVSQNLMIDKTAPVVETSISSEASAKNGYYYNQDVTMTLKVTEKNFFTDKDHLTFDVVKNDGQEGNGTYTGISLAELKDNGIISNYEIYDDQDGLVGKTYTEGTKTYTNERVNTIVLSLNQDAEYTITPHVTDLGGLSNEEEDSDTEQHFVVDKTAPVISVEYSPIEPGYSEDSRAYTQENVTAKITIDEVNFYTSEKTFVTSDEMEQMNFGETKKVALDGSVTSLKNQYKKATENADWSANGYVRTSSPITFEEDANYIFGFTYTDLAGNEAVYAPVYFTVDDTAPEGTVSIDERSWASFLEKITFGIFKNTKYNVSLTSQDATAGVKKTEYYKAYSEKSLDELKAYKNWKDYSEVFSVSPNEQFVIYEKITDKADNVTYVSSDGAIADDTKPVINITNKSTARNGVFGGDVTLNIDVADPEAGATFSGLEKVWYEVHSTGNVVNSKEEVLVDNSGHKVKGNQTWNGNIVIPASQFNSNDVKVQVHALDFSGNQYDSEVVELKIDTTAPVATITFDNNSPLNGKYYNATRTATITVKERNFNPDEVSLNITNTHGTSAVVSGWTVDSSGTSDENVNTCTVAFTEDGDYTMSFSCVDLPGNQSNTVTVDEFTIDKTVPTISVAFDNNNASNGKYYNAPRTATITVVEHNFNGSEVQTAINASLQASGITAPGVNGWTSSGDTNTATVYFGTDGDYSFTVNYTDLAGNAATVATVDSFTIDQTKPEVEIFDIENKSANNGTVAPGVKYSDVNYNSSGVELTITGCEHEKKAIDGSRTSIANGQSIKMADFAHTEDVDDIYTMHAKVTDMAGNSTEKEVIFSVNRFGSTYYFGDDTKEFLNDYYHNQEEDLTVVEINVDEIEVNGISAGHDGELSELKKGTDYKVKAGGNEASWKQYTYTINKENFEKEGQYNITIDSTDKATNKVNNKIKNANIEFVIDKTAPSVVVNGVENGKQYRSDSRDVDIAVSDNVAMGDMNVYVDDMDKAAKSYKSKELVKKNGKVTYTLGSSDNWQNIQVSVTDAAGNKAETELCKVLVTSNVIVQFYRNTMAVVVTLVVLVGIALIILLLAKRRRDQASGQ